MLINLWPVTEKIFQFIFSHWVISLVIIVLLIVGAIFESFGETKPSKYQYKLKHLIMSGSEFEFFKILRAVSQNRYDVFPQIHLDAILDNKVYGQSWFGAFRHINEKSVDFVLCDGNTGKIVLAIELDDRSHEREDRAIRDEEVERILHEAHLPLLRVKNNHTYTQDEVSKLIFDALTI